MNPRKLYCTCGATVGQMVFSHIDPKLRGFGSPAGEVYKNTYSDNAARDTDGMIVPLRQGRYMCKACYEDQSTNRKEWIAIYSDDFGVTTKTLRVTEKTYTKAYLAASLKVGDTIVKLIEA